METLVFVTLMGEMWSTPIAAVCGEKRAYEVAEEHWERLSRARHESRQRRHREDCSRWRIPFTERPFEHAKLKWLHESCGVKGSFDCSEPLFLDGPSDDDSGYVLTSFPVRDGVYDTPVCEFPLTDAAVRVRLELLRQVGVQMRMMHEGELLLVQVVDPRNFHLVWEDPHRVGVREGFPNNEEEGQ